MAGFEISLSGLRANTAQFERAAASVVRASTALPDGPVAAAGSGAPPPLSLAGVDFGADLVGMMLALVNYRANIAALKTEDRLAKVALDLIA
jgi:flagellar hook protein FlgE